MVTEDYVSFETAKLLKEKGFEGDTSCYYVPDSSICWHYQHYQDFDKKDRIECPTLQMAMKWIRDKYKILISPYALSLGWYFEIFDLTNTDISGSKPLHKVGIPSKEEILDSYEKACEAAIKLTLVSLVDNYDKG